MEAAGESEAALLDALTLQEEIDQLNETPHFLLPSSIVIPLINLEHDKSVEHFWKAHFPPKHLKLADLEYTTSDEESDESFDSELESQVSSEDSVASDFDPARHEDQATENEAQETLVVKMPCRCKPVTCYAALGSKVQELAKQFQTLNRREKQLFVSGLLTATNPCKPAVRVRKRQDNFVSTKEVSPNWCLFGQAVCLKFLYRLFGERRVRNASRHARFHRFIAPWRVKGAKGVKHARTAEVIDWLEQFAQHNGLPVPHARGSSFDKPAIQLPLTLPKIAVFREYSQDMTKLKKGQVSQNYFFRLWKKKLPWIRVANRHTDYCNKCFSLREGRNITELNEHLAFVYQQQAYIKNVLRNAMTSFDPTSLSSSCAWMSSDFAQAVRLPWFASYQPGSSFFQSGLRVDIMAIVDDMRLQNSLYLLVEGHVPDYKDANVIISLWWHHMTTTHPLLQCGTLVIHADNTCSQVKNKYIVWFLCWIMLCQPTLKHGVHTVHVLFNLVGHTKFSPDRAFASVKCSMKHTPVFTPAQLLQCCVRQSGNIAHCAAHIPMYDWKAFLSQFFQHSIKCITATTQWTLTSSKRAQISTKVYESGAETYHSIPCRISEEAAQTQALDFKKFPLPVTPLTVERQAQVQQCMSTTGSLAPLLEFTRCACTASAM
jgi:hypothetical protein